MIFITFMTAEDIFTIAQIETECFSVPWSENALRSELDNETALFLTARVNGETAGYVGSHLVAGECYITNIVVSPRFRRQGIARALLTELCRLLMEKGAQFVTLEVRESNTAAIALYKRFGFINAGVIKKMYEKPVEDALIYTLYLIGES